MGQVKILMGLKSFVLEHKRRPDLVQTVSIPLSRPFDVAYLSSKCHSSVNLPPDQLAGEPYLSGLAL
jgi:hypothetical protein